MFESCTGIRLELFDVSAKADTENKNRKTAIAIAAILFKKAHLFTKK